MAAFVFQSSCCTKGNSVTLLWATATIRARPYGSFQTHAASTHFPPCGWPMAMWRLAQAYNTKQVRSGAQNQIRNTNITKYSHSNTTQYLLEIPYLANSHTNTNPGALGKGEHFNVTEPLFTSGLGSLAYQGKWNMFDQQVLSPYLVNKKNKGFSFHSAKVFNKKFVLEKEGQYAGYPRRSFVGNNFKGGYSDHLPTYVFLKKPVK